MKKWLTILMLFTVAGAAAQSDTAFSLFRSIPVRAVDFTVDNLDNLYILTATDQLKKLNASGDSVAVYNEVKKHGKLYSIDVTNPLRIVLFYRSFSTVVILDRLLANKATIDLRRHKIQEASAVAASYDNNLWIFDPLENKLKKIDESGRLLMESADLRQVLSEGIQPTRIIDQGQNVYLYDPKLGVFIFDLYGSFRKKIPVPELRAFTIKDKQIIGVSNNAIVVYNTSNYTTQQYQFPSSFGTFTHYVTGNTKLFTLGKDNISIYNFRFNLQ